MLTPATLRGLAIIAYAVGAVLAFDDEALLLALVLGVGLIGLSRRLRLPTAPFRFRLELRCRESVRVLTATDDEERGRALLQIEATRLQATGASGQLVLVNARTKQPITWQVIDPRGDR